jgi:hypothetical protein
MTRHVLLVPAPDDPHGLLREGLCGARPPLAIRLTVPCDLHVASLRCMDWRATIRSCDTGLSSERALVLAWDGEPVPEGCDRAIRALAAAGATRLSIREHYTIEGALRSARDCDEAGLGTVVIVED